ncbi:hypothetical protein [Acrocarpospora corrugata]|uniref:hypothetical protein n=1 Tax=Acrocarpospora corrugata TaxID=35763 RepID=UPI0012D2E575|nr:hypothetical protein [Acrocarpospora corrugata]
MTDQTPLFDFMMVRTPGEPTPHRLRRGYIDDHGHLAGPQPDEPGLAGLRLVSRVTEVVLDQVLAWSPDDDEQVALESLRADLLALLPARGPIKAKTGDAISLAELAENAHIAMPDGTYRLLPDRLPRLGSPWLMKRLAGALPVVDSATRKFDRWCIRCSRGCSGFCTRSTTSSRSGWAISRWFASGSPYTIPARSRMCTTFSRARRGRGITGDWRRPRTCSRSATAVPRMSVRTRSPLSVTK